MTILRHIAFALAAFVAVHIAAQALAGVQTCAAEHAPQCPGEIAGDAP